MSRLIFITILFGTVMFTAIHLVVVRHESRQLFMELQALQHDVDQLNKEWGQLLLEQATWGTHGRVEQIARDQLHMIVPPGTSVYGIRL